MLDLILASLGINELKLRDPTAPIYSIANRLFMSPVPSNPLQLFLDSFNRGRIGIFLLIGHHVSVLHSFKNGIVSDNKVGIIDPKCDILDCVAKSVQSAHRVARHHYGPQQPLPDVATFVVGEVPEQGEKVTFPYISSFLHKILFELLKNSYRAVVEHHHHRTTIIPISTTTFTTTSSGNPLPDIKIIVCVGKEDITIKVSDEGGGIPLAHSPLVHSYMFTTASPVTPSIGMMTSSELGSGRDIGPIAGFGYGIPISSLYAEYLGGKVHVESMEGWGTDAFVYLNRIGNVVEALHDEEIP